MSKSYDYDINPFPHTKILQQTTLNIFCLKIENHYNWMAKSGKHCGKRRNCSCWALSFFVTMFSKSRLLQRRQKASIWRKGLNITEYMFKEYNRNLGIVFWVTELRCSYLCFERARLYEKVVVDLCDQCRPKSKMCWFM